MTSATSTTNTTTLTRFLIEEQTVAESELRHDVFGPAGIYLKLAA